MDLNAKNVVEIIKDINQYTNIHVMKCATTLFNKNGIVKNIGFYFIMTNILVCIGVLIYFFRKEFIYIPQIFLTIINAKKSKGKQTKDTKDKDNILTTNNKKSKSKKKSKNNEPPKKRETKSKNQKI